MYSRYSIISIIFIFSVDDDECTIDVDNEIHDKYLNLFKRTLTDKLRNAIDINLANDPDGGKGRKKTVQVSKWFFLFYIDPR